MPPTSPLAPLYPLPTGDFRITMRWEPSSMLAMRLTMTPPGQPDGNDVVLPLLHLLTRSRRHPHALLFHHRARNVAIDVPAAQRA